MKETEFNQQNEEHEKTGASFASPAMGLNDNLDFLGKQLHIQTEHSQFPTARIVTQVFCSGRVMLSKKTDCPSGVSEARDFNEIRQLMKAQHCQVIQEIKEKQARKQGSR